MSAHPRSNHASPREGYAPVKNGALSYREIGQGQPIILLHGGPDFDHLYLLPDLDRLSDAYRLIYYDQRGRGRWVGDVKPEEVSIQSEVEDLDGLRQYLQLDSVAVLGHSWGGLLAMEYAVRHPERVSHILLMNSVAASHEGWMLLRQEVRKRIAVHEDRLNALKSSPGYAEGDPDTVAEYYRLRYSTTIRQPEHLERLMRSLRLSFTNEGILRGRQIEEQLYKETISSSDFNLIPRLKQLRIPTLIIHGDNDFIPVEAVAPIAQAIPGARLVVLKECGHFAYIESPDRVRQALANFFAGN